jgi:hypothetical protein
VGGHVGMIYRRRSGDSAESGLEEKEVLEYCIGD